MFSDSIMSTRRVCPHCPNNAGEKNTICNRCKKKTVVHKWESRLANLRRNLEIRFVKAPRLFSSTETHTASTSASQENSAAIAKTMNDVDTISRKSVVSFPLLLGDPKRNIPSILLDTVEDMIPTIHRDSWIALDRPTWTAGKVYISAKKYRKIPEHRCNPPCNMCVRAARMNAGAQLILGGGTTGLEEEEEDSEDD
jgi:hypothetical protein